MKWKKTFGWFCEVLRFPLQLNYHLIRNAIWIVIKSHWTVQGFKSVYLRSPPLFKLQQISPRWKKKIVHTVMDRMFVWVPRQCGIDIIRHQQTVVHAPPWKYRVHALDSGGLEGDSHFTVSMAPNKPQSSMTGRTASLRLGSCRSAVPQHSTVLLPVCGHWFQCGDAFL